MSVHFDSVAEARIKASGIREIFTPHRPIQNKKSFYGRQEQIGRILQTMHTPGQHALLFGERGVGKSSLAIYFKSMLPTSTPVVHVQCDPGMSFRTIGTRVLSQLKGGPQNAQLTIPLTIDDAVNEDAAPSFTGEQLLASEGVLLVDEAEAIVSENDKRQIASFIKILSDRGSPFKVLVVGVSDTGEDLVGQHPSVGRCLREIKLKEMTNDEIREIVEGGVREARMTIDSELTDKIVALSNGYPHFTHLLSLKCAEIAIEQEASSITLDMLTTAMPQAAEDAEISLTKTYREATRSYGTNMYKNVLTACVATGKDEFTAGELRQAITRITGEEITQQGLNNYLNRLVDEGVNKILRRVHKGVYRLNDPRMATYIRIASGRTDI